MTLPFTLPLSNYIDLFFELLSHSPETKQPGPKKEHGGGFANWGRRGQFDVAINCSLVIKCK